MCILVVLEKEGCHKEYQKRICTCLAYRTLLRPWQMQVKKLSARSWEQAKTVTSGIANASLELQAQWLWESYSGTTGASFLEREGLEGAGLVASSMWRAHI